MDTRPELPANPILAAADLAKHTHPPTTRKQLEGELKCRLLERRQQTLEIEAISARLRAFAQA